MSDCVGVVGMGLMGSAFTHHLLQGGFKVRGHDIDEQRGCQLHERGGTPVESAAGSCASQAVQVRRCIRVSSLSLR